MLEPCVLGSDCKAEGLSSLLLLLLFFFFFFFFFFFLFFFFFFFFFFFCGVLGFVSFDAGLQI